MPVGITPAIKYAASLGTVRNDLTTNRSTLFLESWYIIVSVQIGIQYLRTDITTDARRALRFCLGPPTLGINAHLTDDAVVLACSKLRRLSFIIPDIF